MGDLVFLLSSTPFQWPKVYSSKHADLLHWDTVATINSVEEENGSWASQVRISVETGSGQPGHPGTTRFTNYPGLTRIGSREKRNCSFDDVETYKRYRVALS